MKKLTQQAYFAAPVWLQNVLTTAYGMHVQYLRYGAQQRAQLARLLETQWHTKEQLAEAQLADLDRAVRHAYETVPHYRDRGVRLPARLSLDALRELPLVTKEQLQQPRERLVSSAYADKRLPAIHTGGTTGKPLSIYCDRDTLQRNYAFFGRLRSWGGVSPNARTAVFAGRTTIPPSQRRPPFWRVNPAAHSLLFSSYHISPATLPHYAKALERFDPELIDSYPSSIEPVARYLLEAGITTIRPRAIVTSSETLDPTARAVIEKAFGCRLFDYYGAAEMAAFVTQCEHGRYHPNPEFGVLEILREDGSPARPGENGSLVATGFINRVMPLIRYATGDEAVPGEPGCPCGRNFPVIERLVGRMDDVIITPEGRRIGRLDPIFKSVATLFETRIVQDASDHVRVEVVLTGPFAPRERADLERELAARIGPSMRIDIVEVPSIPRSASGKLRTVVNEMRTSLQAHAS